MTQSSPGTVTRVYRGLPPGLFQPVFELRRRLLRGRAWEDGLGRAHRAAFRPLRVLQGPFAGTLLRDDRPRRDLPSPKHLGTYEIELADAVEALVAEQPRRVIVIGAAEGLYTVGLARRLPEAEHVAYEGLPLWRWRAERNARDNGVADRIDFRGFCDPNTLRRDLGDAAAARGTLIVCDCEGYEDELLRPDENPGLAHATILVELHPMFREGIEETIPARFAATHEIERIEQRERTLDDLPAELAGLDADTAMRAMRETRRGATPFLVMRPRRTGVTPADD